MESTKQELKIIVRDKYPAMPSIFYKIADQIINTFGYRYPDDTLSTIDEVAYIFDELI